jgi:hypothetical protein
MNAITPRAAVDAPDTQPASYRPVPHAQSQYQPDPARARRTADRTVASRWTAPEADEATLNSAAIQDDVEPWTDQDALDSTLLPRLIAAVALAVVALAVASALLA